MNDNKNNNTINNQNLNGELQVKNVKLYNAKISTIKNLKIFEKSLHLVAPYVLCAGITFISMAGIGHTPFYKDNVKAYAVNITEADSNKNIIHNKQYKQEDSFSSKSDNTTNKFYYYSKWQKNQDGSYSRNVQEYFVKNMDYEEIISLLNKKDMEIEYILKEPISSVVEVKNDLTKEELEKDSYLKAIIYDKDKNDYIICKQNVVNNKDDLCIYMLATITNFLLISLYREKKSNFDYKNSIEKIKQKY